MASPLEKLEEEGFPNLPPEHGFTFKLSPPPPDNEPPVYALHAKSLDFGFLTKPTNQTWFAVATPSNPPGCLVSGVFNAAPYYDGWDALTFHEPLKEGDVICTPFNGLAKYPSPDYGRHLYGSELGKTCNGLGLTKTTGWIPYRPSAACDEWFVLNEEEILQAGDVIIFEPENDPQVAFDDNEGGYAVAGYEGHSVIHALNDMKEDGHPDARALRKNNNPITIKATRSEGDLIFTQPLPLP